MRRKALITGICGQDGSYLAEFLLNMGYEVHGLIRRASLPNSSRIQYIFQESYENDRRLFLHYGDMTDPGSLSKLISDVQPDEVYNLAAQSHVRVSFDQPHYTHEVNAIGTLNLLSAVVTFAPKAKFYQASSSELYGSTPPPQNENTDFRPRSPYAVSKLTAYWNVVQSREANGLFATNGILFNHESPRRGVTFVTRKITVALPRLISGEQPTLPMGNLDAQRDWGFAPEYAIAMWKMLQLDNPVDLVIATEQKVSVREFAKYCFNLQGKNYQDFITFDSRFVRPTEVDSLEGDASLAKKLIDWKPMYNWKMIAECMAIEDAKKYSKYGEAAVSAPYEKFDWSSLGY